MLRLPVRRGATLVLGFVVACGSVACAAESVPKTIDPKTIDDKNDDKDKKDKSKPSSGQIVDSGSFGVFIKNQRVVTESFSIHQENGNSIIKAQLSEIGGATASSQKSDLEITANGELLRYDWSQEGAGSLTVLPKDEFLIEKISTSASGKPAEQPFLMPNTSIILDNNFFVQREVLVWRYLSAACKQESGNFKCQKDPVEFGVLVPQDRNSMRVRLVLVAKEKVTIRGQERDLLRLNLTGDGYEWGLWVDDSNQFKLMRISIPADNTEVLRD